MSSRPLTIVPGSDPSQFLPRNFSGDNSRITATGNQIDGPTRAFSKAAKVPYVTACPFQRYRRRYRRIYSTLPGGKIVVTRKEGELFAIKEIKESKPLAMTRFDNLRQIPHPNFQHVHEILLAGDTYFTVCDHEAITLWEIVRCPIPPAEIPISSIASQLIEGIAFLASVGAIHGALFHHNVHLSYGGHVKIGFNIDMKFQQKPLLVSPDCQQLQKIVLDIMKSESLHDVVDSSRWSLTITDFVRSLSHEPVQRLQMHSFLRIAPNNHDLRDLIDFVKLSTNVRYDSVDLTGTMVLL